MYLLLERVVFHCYVSLLEGTSKYLLCFGVWMVCFGGPNMMQICTCNTFSETIRHRWYQAGSKYWKLQGLAAWFRAKSTTQSNILILRRWQQVHRLKENLSNPSFKWWKVLCFSSWHPPSQHHLQKTSMYLFPLKFKSIPVKKIGVLSPKTTIFWLVGNLNHPKLWTITWIVCLTSRALVASIPHPGCNHGKWRLIFVAIRYKRWTNPGGDCY